MEITLEQVAGQIADISKQLSGFETRLTTAVTDLKHQAAISMDDLKHQAAINMADLKHQTALNMDDLKQEVKLAGEGYGATLEGIERQLVELNAKVDTKFSDHDSILADHGLRITTLEERR